MEKLYRKDYTGEFCVYNRTQQNGTVAEVREWVPNTIQKFAHTGNAVVIGNGPSRKDLNLYYISHHGGGHKGKRKLTSYGCNALYRDMAPNFLVVTSDIIANEVVETGYISEHVVLTHPTEILKYPGKFHLIPHDRYWSAGAIATWLACFDGQKKIYLLGFDNQLEPGKNLNVYAGSTGYQPTDTLVNDDLWIETMRDIFLTYSDVEFVWINPTSMPESWKYVSNIRQVTMRQFVIEADLGA